MCCWSRCLALRRCEVGAASSGPGLAGGAGAPASPADLDDLTGADEVLQALVDPRAAHAGLIHQVRHGDAFGRGERESKPETHLRNAPRIVWGAPRFVWGVARAVGVV